MKKIIYWSIKIFRFLLALVISFLIIWLAPFPHRHVSIWIELPALIFGLLLSIAGFFGYWFEEAGEIGLGSYSGSLYYGIFGLIISGHILMRFAGL